MKIQDNDNVEAGFKAINFLWIMQMMGALSSLEIYEFLQKSERGH